MINNEAVSNLIRKGKAFQLPSVISTSREQGMQLMDTDLMRLLKEGKITAEDAYVKAVSKKEFESLVDEEEKKMQAVKKAPGARVQAAASRPAQGDGADGAPRPAQPPEPGARKPAASTPPAARKP
jgi:hypothetical protein